MAEHPRLLALGATHTTAELALRERLAALDASACSQLADAVRRVSRASECLVLSTCNRLEVYAVDTPDPSAVLAAVATAASVDREILRSAGFELRGADAAAHLFEVAASLDSQIVGETEITGQVKDAYATAHAHGSTGPVLNRLVQKALQSAKWIRSNTSIGTGQVSVATVAVDLAAKIFGDLSAARVLVVGAGDIGEKTARALSSRGATSITVAARRPEAAAALATPLGGSALPFDQLASALNDHDIVLSSTSAPHAVISVQMVADALHRRADRPLFLVDLALPRDIDPGVADLDGAYVYNLQDLAAIADANIAARQAEVSRCRALVRSRAASAWADVERRPPSPRAQGDALPVTT